MLAQRRFLLLTAAACSIATPLLAQSTDSYSFLKAVREGDGAAVQAVVSNPSATAINARDASGEGALHILVRRRDLTWLSYLLSHGARANIEMHDGTTPLGLAAQIGWIDGATQLVARGATVDQPNNRGETPLILAVQARQLPMIRFLITNGANPDRQDNYGGYSAMDYARQDTRNPEILRALEASRPQRTNAMGPTPQ